MKLLPKMSISVLLTTKIQIMDMIGEVNTEERLS